MINVLTKSLDWVMFGVRVYDTYQHTDKAIRKMQTYDPNNWQTTDYLEVEVHIGHVVSETMALGLEKKLSQKESKDLLSKVNVWNGVKYGCYLGEELLDGQRSIGQILLSKTSLLRLSNLAKQNNHPNLSNALQITGYVTNFLQNNIQIQHFIPGNHGNLVFPVNFNYPTIPQAHHNNQVFMHYMCPITQEPARYPVAVIGNNNIVHYFELSAIVVWLSNHNTDPVTNLPLYLQQIQVNLQALGQIQAEMQQLGLPLQ